MSLNILRYILVSQAFMLPAFAQTAPRHLDFQAFGDVPVYGDPARGGRLAIMISDQTVPAVAREAIGQAIAARGGLAASVDYERFIIAMGAHPEKCAYHAWEFEKLSKVIQQTVGVERYQPAILAGLGRGASLAYTVISEEHDGAFAGLFTTGLCLPFSMPKELCANEGKTWIPTRDKAVGLVKPLARTNDVILALPASVPGMCLSAVGAEFFGAIEGATVLPESKSKWGTAEWQSDVASGIEQTLAKLANTKPPVAGLDDLPLDQQLATQPAGPLVGKTMAIIISGDGGWASLDQDVAKNLAASGVNVIGLNSLKFFWKRRTPDETAEALSRIIDHYAETWQAKNVILIGYSFGADVLPFAVTRLPEYNRARVKAVALLGPSLKTDFEFNVGDWLGTSEDPQALPIAPEIMALPPIPTLCVYGAEQAAETACTQVHEDRVRLYKTEGGHHFDGDFKAMTGLILDLMASPR